MKCISSNADFHDDGTVKDFLVARAEAGRTLLLYVPSVLGLDTRTSNPWENLVISTAIDFPDLQILENWAHRLRSLEKNKQAPVLSEMLYEMSVTNLGIPDGEKQRQRTFSC
jgi:hypothetical protein